MLDNGREALENPRMPTVTSEAAFEDSIEAHLLGHGWLQGRPLGLRPLAGARPGHN